MSEISFSELSERIKNNDNRGTAKPYLLLLRERREYVAHDEYGDGEEVYVDLQGDYHKTETLEEMIQFYKDHFSDEEEFKDNYPDGLIEDEHYAIHRMGSYMGTVNVFITDKGYHEHMELNGHNVQRSKGGHDTYGIHAFRNPEISAMFKAIDSCALMEGEIKTFKNENQHLCKQYNELADRLKKSQDDNERLCKILIELGHEARIETE